MRNVKFVLREQAKSKAVLSALNTNLVPKGRYITEQRGEVLHILINDNTGYAFAKVIMELELEHLALDLPGEQAAKIVFEIEKRTWKLNKFKTDKQYALKEIEVISKHPKELEKAYVRYAALIMGQNLCKELAESPPNVIYPESFAKQCEQLSAYGVEVEILGRAELTELKMNAVLAVSGGSSKEPKVVVMKYTGDASNPDSIAFIGKGVCFDAGGLFIKDQVMMPKMKYDKSGAAAVVGGILAISHQKLKVNVIGVIGLVENMPDGNASRPSDVITSMSGKTIEIADPDAEGRLVLADCLYYTQNRFKPSFMVSLATLTGDTVACLAYEYAGLFTRDEDLASRILKAAEVSGDSIWRLPLGDNFKELTKSSIADIKNIGITGCGDNASAAEFLYEFTGNTKFAHLDIAGVVWSDEETPKKAKGATGYGVGVIEELASCIV